MKTEPEKDGKSNRKWGEQELLCITSTPTPLLVAHHSTNKQEVVNLSSFQSN